MERFASNLDQLPLNFNFYIFSIIGNDKKLLKNFGYLLHYACAVDDFAEIKRLIDNGYLEKAQEIDENCFVSPAVITVKKDKSIKIALDSRKLNDISIKRKGPNA